VLDASGRAIQIDRDTVVTTPAQLKEQLTTLLLDRPDVLDAAVRISIERETGIDTGTGVEELIDALNGPTGQSGELAARHLIGSYLGRRLTLVEPDGTEHTYGTGRPIVITVDVDEHGHDRWSALAVDTERVERAPWTPQDYNLKEPDQPQVEGPWRSANFCVEMEIDGVMQRACVSVAALIVEAGRPQRLEPHSSHFAFHRSNGSVARNRRFSRNARSRGSGAIEEPIRPRLPR
jgi:hypothetical protein